MPLPQTDLLLLETRGQALPDAVPEGTGAHTAIDSKLTIALRLSECVDASLTDDLVVHAFLQAGIAIGVSADLREAGGGIVEAGGVYGEEHGCGQSSGGDEQSHRVNLLLGFTIPRCRSCARMSIHGMYTHPRAKQ